MKEPDPSPESPSQELLVEMGRLNGLSDGVFAFALTLLVLDIRIPEGVLEGNLAAELTKLAPKALIYLISFVVIGWAWASHQRMFSQIKRGDGALVWLNLLSLLFVTLMPASAAFLGRFPNAFIAITCFAVDVILIQLSARWLWRHAGRNGLVNPTLDSRVVASIGQRLNLSAIVFGLSIPLALFNTTLTYLLWIGIFILLFTTDWLSWQQAIKTQHAAIPLEGAARALVRLQYRAGQLNIVAGAESQYLLQGVFGGGLDSRITRRGEDLDVELNMLDRKGFMSMRFPWTWGPANILDWTFNLRQEIPTMLDIELASGSAILELGELQVTGLNMKTGGSSVEIGLPAHAGQTSVDIQANASSLLIRVPPGTAAHIRMSKAVATAEINIEQFPMVAAGREYRSANYETAVNRADIQLDVSLGSVKIL